MFIDVFRAVPPETRRQNLVAYRQFLEEHDGVADFEKRQLSRREERMARYERPLARIRDIDRGLFMKQYNSFDPSVQTPAEMLLLLTLVKLNAAEAWAVDTTYEEELRRRLVHDDGCEVRVLVQETYHTRILLSAARLYGIEITTPYRPPAGLRGLIGTIGRVPKSVARPLILASEVLGVLIFINLLEKSREILSHDPELRDSVEERLCEVLTDEIGHVSYNRACIGPLGMTQARAVLPLVAIGLSRAFPEMNALGAMSSASSDDVTSLVAGRGLPEHVMRSAFVG